MGWQRDRRAGPRRSRRAGRPCRCPGGPGPANRDTAGVRQPEGSGLRSDFLGTEARPRSSRSVTTNSPSRCSLRMTPRSMRRWATSSATRCSSSRSCRLAANPAKGLIGAAFRHRTSRAGDPQLHTHVLVANLALGEDGRWSAIDSRCLFRHARTAGFVYQAHLRSSSRGASASGGCPVVHGCAELDGIPKPVLRAFSRRRADIERALDAAWPVERRGRRGRGAVDSASQGLRRGPRGPAQRVDRTRCSAGLRPPAPRSAARPRT